MKVKVLLVKLLFLSFLFLAECVNSRQSAGSGGGFNSKKESRTNRSRGEVMENLFIIFDPSFLSYVWPKIKNGVHLNLGHLCWEDVSVLLRDLSEGRAWAYRAADASGRYHSGLFEGRRFWLGSKQQCLKLDASFVHKGNNDTWGEFYSGDYLNTLISREKEIGGNVEEWRALVARDALLRRAAAEDNAPPVALAYTALRVALNITKFTMPKSFEITLGLCLPRTCAAEDVVSIINFSIMLNDHLKTNRTVSRSVKITSLRYIESNYDIRTDIGAVTLIMVTVTLVILAVVATIVDLDLVKFKTYGKTSSFDLQQYNHEGKRKVEENKVNVGRKEPTTSTSYDLQQYRRDDKRYTEEKKAHNTRKELKLLEAEAPNITSFSELKRAMRDKALPPTITLDVVTPEATSCYRCGKYKKQCPNSAQVDPKPCPRLQFNSCSSLTTEYKKSGLSKTLLLSFSLKHSWMRIFNTSMANKDLAMMHVLKIVAVLWIMFVHVAVIVDYIAENGRDGDEHNDVYYILSTGTLAFDTLFFVSGVLSAQHFFYLKSRYSVEELVAAGGVCGQALQLLCFVTNRAIRLLPPYMYAIFLTSVLSRVSRDTAVLLLPERDYDTCDSYWWRNLLYLSDLYPRDEQCMQISWYLTTETQLHVLGALLCMLLATGQRRCGAALAAAAVCGAAGYDLTTAYTDFALPSPTAFGLYSLVVARGWARAAPYCAGVLGGWLLYVMDGDCAVSKTSLWCFWSATASSLLASLALPWVSARWLAAWLHLAWPAALLWPTLLAATKFAACSRSLARVAGVAGASRLCYCALLLHGLLARALLLAVDAPLCAHLYCVVCYFAGTALVTLAAALGLALLLEMPCCCLLRRISDYTYR